MATSLFCLVWIMPATTETTVIQYNLNLTDSKGKANGERRKGVFTIKADYKQTIGKACSLYRQLKKNVQLAYLDQGKLICKPL